LEDLGGFKGISGWKKVTLIPGITTLSGMCTYENTSLHESQQDRSRNLLRSVERKHVLTRRDYRCVVVVYALSCDVVLVGRALMCSSILWSSSSSSPCASRFLL